MLGQITYVWHVHVAGSIHAAGQLMLLLPPVQACRLMDAYDEFRSRRRMKPLSQLAHQQMALEASLQQVQQQLDEGLSSNSPGAGTLTMQCRALGLQV